MARVLGAPGLVRREVERAEMWLTPPGTWASPSDITGTPVPAQVPGTVASALRDAGQWRDGDARDLDAEDAWFRCRVAVPPGDGALRVRFEGVATGAAIWVDGVAHAPAVSALRPHVIELSPTTHGELEVVFVCRALATTLAQKWPRPRWKTRLVPSQNLRFVRTPLIGRMPAFSPGPAPVGPLRPIVIERAGTVDVVRARVRASIGDALDAGEVTVELALAAPLGAPPTLRVGTFATTLSLDADGRTARGVLHVDAPARWWPHTHGAPVLHPVRVDTEAGSIELSAVGFRALDWPTPEAPVRVNGQPCFVRGGAWLPLDPVRMIADAPALRAALTQLRDAGANMLRVPGTGMYETDAFYALCDELGILVWQDALLANLDYPTDDGFTSELRAELDALLDRVEASPCLAVVCGGSEVEQQATMWGHPPGELGWPLLDEVGAVARARRPDVAVVRNSPTGGPLPFHVGAGVAHYYGVGAYRRPLEDARRARVRFASECLALANLGDDPRVAIDVGVPRDVGASWDFADIRDHYLALLYGVDPRALRELEPTRYVALSRVVSGQVMAATYGEWRSGGVTHGALIWHWNDVAPGAGWGVVDVRGAPKAAYWHLRRAWAPVALVASDEGQDGVWLHVRADRPEVLVGATLEVRVLRDGALELARGSQRVDGPVDVAVDALLGRFMDTAYAYRFGPPGHDAVVATVRDARGALLADTVHFPVGRPAAGAADLGLAATLEHRGDGQTLVLTTARLAHAVAIAAPGCVLGDDYVDVVPGQPREVPFTLPAAAAPTTITLTPLNGPPVALTLIG